MDAVTLGTVVTAIATVALCAVTAVLAIETRRLAAMTARPQVVALIRPARSGSGFADLHVENTGNASAFDIRVEFDPPLTYTPVDDDNLPPLQRISVLTPGQALTSFLCDYRKIIDVEYQVKVAWRNNPHNVKTEQLSYTIAIADIKGSTHLEGGDPLFELARHVEELSKNAERVLRGRHRLKVDTHNADDRRQEREEVEQWVGRTRKARSVEPTPPANRAKAAPRKP